MAAGDLPFAEWAAVELAALAATIDPRVHQAVPLAVELDHGSGIEVLWDRPVQTAPLPWEATDGGWSWRSLHDLDEPTPLTDRPCPMPGLVTVGWRENRQLLVDLEHIGPLAITGPRQRVEALLASIITDLGNDSALSDAAVYAVGLDTQARKHQHVRRAGPTDAVQALTATSTAARHGIGDDAALFHRRLGPNPLPTTPIVVAVVGFDVQPGDQQRIASAVAPGHGTGAVATSKVTGTRAQLEIRNDGTANLTGLAGQPLQIVAAGTSAPRPTNVANPPIRTYIDHAVALVGSDQRGDKTNNTDDQSVATFGAEADLHEPGTDGHVDSAAPVDAVMVRLFGQPRADGYPEIRGMTLRLLCYLACQHSPVSISRIRNTVWAGAARDRKTISNKLSELRAALGTTASGEPLVSLATPEGITLHDSVRTDLDRFDDLLDRSHDVSSNQAIDLLQEALDLVAGQPFDDDGYHWADIDHRLNERIVEAAIHLHELATEEDDLFTARQALTAGLRGVPLHEGLYRLLMQLEYRTNGPSAVHDVFRELNARLDALDCQPAPETQTTYQQLTSGNQRP